MPNGEFSPSRNAERVSATPSPSRVAQQRDPVGARDRGARLRHLLLHDPALDALGVLGLGRRVGLGDQHVAVGQHVQPARVLEPVRERVDGHPGRDVRLARPRASRARARSPPSASSTSSAPAASASGPCPIPREAAPSRCRPRRPAQAPVPAKQQTDDVTACVASLVPIRARQDATVRRARLARGAATPGVPARRLPPGARRRVRR